MRDPKLFPIIVTEVHQVAAPSADQRRGLLAFLAFTINGDLRLEGIALRRTTTGRLALSYPSKPVSSSRRHYYVRPLSDQARLAIEKQVFRALGLIEVSR